MSVQKLRPDHDLPHWGQRVDLAAAFRWAVRFDWHEAVANHFSVAVDPTGAKFLMNANLIHFRRVTASNLLLIDADDPETMRRPDAPDPTAWGLHGAIHRRCPHAVCALHVHSTYATVLASLADSGMPAIDQNTAMFHDRVVVDEHYGGLAFEEEGERCAALFANSGRHVMVMGNHGVMVVGASVAEAFYRLYYFERAARNLILAYSTGRPLRFLSPEIAEKTARQMDHYGDAPDRFLGELKAILDAEEPDYRA
jgi:ribulose-5-phosphate 4-epimerase/fuculose-1-phosphate aldolase